MTDTATINIYSKIYIRFFFSFFFFLLYSLPCFHSNHHTTYYVIYCYQNCKIVYKPVYSSKSYAMLMVMVIVIIESSILSFILYSFMYFVVDVTCTSCLIPLKLLESISSRHLTTIQIEMSNFSFIVPSNPRPKANPQKQRTVYTKYYMLCFNVEHIGINRLFNTKSNNNKMLCKIDRPCN